MQLNTKVRTFYSVCYLSVEMMTLIMFYVPLTGLLRVKTSEVKYVAMGTHDVNGQSLVTSLLILLTIGIK